MGAFVFQLVEFLTPASHSASWPDTARAALFRIRGGRAGLDADAWTGPRLIECSPFSEVLCETELLKLDISSPSQLPRSAGFGFWWWALKQSSAFEQNELNPGQAALAPTTTPTAPGSASNTASFRKSQLAWSSPDVSLLIQLSWFAALQFCARIRWWQAFDVLQRGCRDNAWSMDCLERTSKEPFDAWAGWCR